MSSSSTFFEASLKLNGVTRLMALGCIVASLPIALLQYPWLPATVIEFAELQHDPAPWGTESFHIDRERRLGRVEPALILYALGTLALSGLGAIVLKIFPWWADLAIWIMTAATCVAIAQFVRPIIGPSTDPVYSAIMICLPLGIAITCTLAALMSLGSQLMSKNIA
jgi:hypothetical protein